MSLLSSIGRKITDFLGTSQPAPQPPMQTPMQTPSRMTVGVAQPQGNISVASPMQQPQVSVAAPMQQPRMTVAPAAPQVVRFNNIPYANTTSIPAPSNQLPTGIGATLQYLKQHGVAEATGKEPVVGGPQWGDAIANRYAAYTGQTLNGIKSLPGGFVNTAQLLPRAAAVGADTIRATVNPNAQNDSNLAFSTNQLSNTYQQSIPNSMITPTWHGIQAVEQTRAGNPVWYGYNQYKQNQKNQKAIETDQQAQDAIQQVQQGVKAGRISRADAADAIDQISKYSQAYSQNKEVGYNKALVNAGFNPTDSPSTIGRKFVSNAGQTYLNAETLGAAAEAQPAETALGRVAGAANNSGKFMAAANTVGVLGQDKIKPADLITAPLTGYTQGAFLGAALHPSDVVGATQDIADRVKLPNESGAAEVGGPLIPIPKQLIPGSEVQPTTMDKIIANTTGSTPEQVAADRVAKAEKTGKPAVSLKDGLTKTELDVGEALGMSRKDILAAKNDTGLETAFQARTKNMAPQDLADLSSREQMALANRKGTPLAPQEVNTAANPHTSLLADVAPGDHAAAISNSQLVSRPIDTARGLWEHSMSRLTPEERANFWRATEDPTNPSHSPAMQEAIGRWRQADNMVHANSQALGGNTNYLTDHALHPWQLPEEFTQHLINGGSPKDFKGLNNISRKYRTIAEGEANGLKLGTDPLKEGSNYLQANSSILRKTALKQGLEMADSGATSQPFTRDLGNGHTVQLSKEGFAATKGVAYSPKSSNPVVRTLRSANQFTKGTILSLGQFHPINIGVRAAATLVEKGHPVEAAKGLYGTFRGAFGTEYADRVIGKALDDGTVERAAQIGMPYGAPHEGATIGRGIGSNTVFNKQMPMMHDAVARSIIADLEKRNIDLSSPEARAAGQAGAKVMGEINTETMNIPPKVSHALSDALLASKYTHSKFSQLKTAADLRNVGTVGGSYARANVAANVVSTAAIIVGVGALGHQQSDSVRDSMLRALVDPAIPTPMTDKKGNTVKLKLPGTDTSDLAKLVGIKLVRNPDGHLGVSWDPKNLPTGVEDFARARLAPWLSTGVKVATNTSYAGKPMYDPNAPAGIKAQQAGTTVAQGLLPIGLQGVPNTEAVKQHLPQGVQDVLNANAPGGNPVVKSIGSSFGVTPTTDMTVGKGLESSRYFSALDDAKSGLNRQEKDAIDLYTGSKKNPVTGAYDVQPSVQDTSTKAKVLLQNPKAVDKLVEMNQKLSGLGQSVDPLWQQPTSNITKYLQYQTMPPGGADRSHWMTQNQSWYTPLSDARNAFFDKLPAGDPNKPAAPIEFPAASPDVAAKQKTFFSLPDSQARAQYLTENPEVQTQLDKQVEYNNKMREAQGYSALDTFPKANPQVQKVIDTYNALPKNDGPKGGNKTRSLWIQNHPQEYGAMTNYFTQSSLYGLEQSAGQAQFKDTGLDQKGLKDLYSLGQYDVQKLTDDNGNTFYALGSGSGSSGSNSGSSGYTYVNGKRYTKSTTSKGSSGSSSYSKYGPGSYRYNQAVYDSHNPYKYSIDLDTGGGAQVKPKVSVKGASSKSKVASRGGSGKPKVTIKRSLA